MERSVIHWYGTVVLEYFCKVNVLISIIETFVELELKTHLILDYSQNVDFNLKLSNETSGFLDEQFHQ